MDPVPSETRFARSGDLHIAYQVLGDGPLDLVYSPGWVSHVELAFEDPLLGRFLRRMASFARLICFDKRGTGLSDRVPTEQLPTLEDRMDDLRAVMDAVGSQRAAIFGFSEGGNLATLFAATFPERTVALATFGIFAKRIWSPDYPWAPTPEERERTYEIVERDWGGAMDLSTLVPSKVDDPAFLRRLATYLRRAASPGAALALLRMNTQIDIRNVLPSIRVPTLVMHRTRDRDANIEEARWIAAQIPNARLVEFDGDDHLPWVGDQDSVVDELQEFLTGVRPAPEADRVLATVLFTDICNSTVEAVRLGDRRWRELLAQHHALVREQLARFRGQEVDTAGDGFFATFDGPARAVRCACAARDAMRTLGLEIRAGLHTGEIELADDKASGIAVHIASRVVASAGPGEVVVSSTVKDLVSGSALEFSDRGMHALKGIPGQWRLFGVVDLEPPRSSRPPGGSTLRSG
jgi:class 3 adenylate cyclase